MMETRKILEQVSNYIDDVGDENVKQAFHLILNIVEEQSTENRKLLEEIQKLRDENNRLKGEQGKPEIKPNNNKDQDKNKEAKNKNNDHSSEKERKGDSKKNGKKKGKKKDLPIDYKQICSVSKDDLPDDAVFKGHESVVVQDMIIRRENTEFNKEVYYSPLLKKSFRGTLPRGYCGEFGPNLKANVIFLHHVCNVSEPKIHELITNIGIRISRGTISNILIKGKESFHKEKNDNYLAGLESNSYQQIDDTGTRVNGVNHYAQIVTNPHTTTYFTTKRKDRLTVLDILSNLGERIFYINDDTFQLLAEFKVPKKTIGCLENIEKNGTYDEKELEALLKYYVPDVGKNHQNRIKEAAGITAYRLLNKVPVTKILVSDDAKQFKYLTENLALCWVHDARHYKKLRPIVPCHIKELEQFRDRYWKFYKELQEYKKKPTKKHAKRLLKDFDILFSTKTNYDALDDRISKTKAKQEGLLLVLTYPEVPLHNNDAELAARVQVRKRDVSLQTRTEEGTQAKDIFLSLFETTKKLGINAYDYILDRITQNYEICSLSELIRSRGTKT